MSEAGESALGVILGHAYSFWGSAILAAGLKHRVFDHLAAGAARAAGLASRASISVRGSQALLDGLLGLGLVRLTEDGYANVPRLETYLVSRSDNYIGGYADLIVSTLGDWAKLPDSVASGAPQHRQESADPSNPFWDNLVRALAPLGFVPARAAAERLGLATRDAFRMLDVGGGAGAYTVTWLGLNPGARSAQLDWPNVNAIARDYVARFGYASRFETIDGDMEKVDLDSGAYNYVVYSNVAHGLSDERNIEMFRRIRRWLKPGGTLLISGLVPNADRTGHPILLMFSANLLLNTEQGTTHVRSDYDRWLREGGFARVEYQPLEELPFTLIYAS